MKCIMAFGTESMIFPEEMQLVQEKVSHAQRTPSSLIACRQLLTIVKYERSSDLSRIGSS